MRVLIIDDDPDLRNLLIQYIRQQWPAGDIAEYDPLQRDLPGPDFPLQSYDVIILDYMLGRGDGLRWLEELKKRPKCPPIIFLTGAGSEIIAVRAMKLGAADYQRKQELSKERLITAIRDVAHGKIEKTVTPEIAARMEGHVLGARLRIPGIRVLRLIGEGGMSRVYLASREADDEPLVVKILRSEIMQDKRTMARFVEEYNLV
jgi:DNA-binding response OmpR family regulator